MTKAQRKARKALKMAGIRRRNKPGKPVFGRGHGVRKIY